MPVNTYCTVVMLGDVHTHIHEIHVGFSWILTLLCCIYSIIWL
jgi:hypothetical protein